MTPARRTAEPYPICAKCRQDIKSKKITTARDGATFHPGCWDNSGPIDLAAMATRLRDRERLTGSVGMTQEEGFQVAKILEDHNMLHDGLKDSISLREEAYERIDTLLAENEAMREALKGVMGWYNLTDVAALMSDKGEQAEYHRTIMLARAALARKGSGE